MERTSATLVEGADVTRTFGDFEFEQPNATVKMSSPAELKAAGRVEHGETEPPQDLIVVLHCFLI